MDGSAVRNSVPGPGPERRRRRSPLRGQSGLSLIEAIAGTVIAVLAVVGLAYSFSTARAMVERYRIARLALGEAESRIERLSLRRAGNTDLDLGTHGPFPVPVAGQALCEESWKVEAYDDPANGTSAGAVDMKKVTVTVTWGQPVTAAQTVTLSTLLPR